MSSTGFKTTALITLGAFFFNGILGQPLYAAIELSKDHAAARSLATTLIPSSIGRISGGREFDNGSLVILVQDLHGNPSAQKNIHQILTLLTQKNPGARVFLEGAPRGQFTPELLASIPDARTREEAARALLDRGILSGGEYYALQSSGNVFGLEDETYYRDNLFRLRALTATKSARGQAFQNLSSKITRLKQAYYSRSLRALERSVSRIKDDGKSPERLCRAIEKTAAAYREDLSRYPNLEKYVRVNSLGRRLSWNRIAREQTAVLEELKSKAPYRQYSEIQSAMSRDAGEFYTAVQKTALHYIPELQLRYPQFAALLAWHALNREINPLELLNERDDFTARLYDKAAVTITERNIAFLDAATRRARDLALLTITPSDYAAFLRDESRYRELARMYLGEEQASGLEDILDDRNLRRYHTANLDRNRIFVQAMVPRSPVSSSPQEANTMPRDVSIVVSGGFHTGIADILAQNRVSYLLVTPQITGRIDEDFFAGMVAGTMAPDGASRSAFGWLASLAARACDGGHANVFRAIVGVTLRCFIRSESSLPAVEQFAKDWFTVIEKTCRERGVDAPQLHIEPTETGRTVNVSMQGSSFAWRIESGTKEKGAPLFIASLDASGDTINDNDLHAALSPIAGASQRMLDLVVPDSIQKRKELSETITPANRDYLMATAKQTWQFYADTVNESTNYLPPDFVEMDEKTGEIKEVIYRTSTTNIGIYVLSTVIAMRMGLVAPEEALFRIRKTVEAVEKLLETEGQHYEGHLFNWYSIEGTPGVIWGKHVSTVDNGNLAGFLMAATEGLAEAEGMLNGQAVQDSAGLRKRMARIVDGMDFDLLYDKKAGLLYRDASVETRDGKEVLVPHTGHYNMVVSEARIAYMVAIMQGKISSQAWHNLCGRITGRGVVNDGMPLQSWSGTMFEYLLPWLLAKEEPKTLIGQAVRAAVLEQMKARKGKLWGKSEAAAVVTPSWAAKGYENDVYAAWGVPALAHAREFMHAVFAPYASMMAARMVPNAVADNLREFESPRINMRGRYGFFESVTVVKRKWAWLEWLGYKPMRRYYAHHQGMAFLGLANALVSPESGGIITNWFHNHPSNNGTVEELVRTDKYPEGTLEPGVAYERDPELSSDTDDFVGNFGTQVYAPDAGWSGWAGGDYALSCNKVFYIKDVESGTILPAGLEPPYEVVRKYGKAEFKYRIKTDDGEFITVIVELSYSPIDTAEVWKLTIQNDTASERAFEVTGYQDWIMGDINAYLNHPVLQNLYVRTEYKKGVITARRRTVRGPKQDLQPIGFFMIGGEEGKRTDGWETSRLAFLGRLGNLAAPSAVLKHAFQGKTGYTLNPAAALSKTVKVPKGRSRGMTFISGCAGSPDEVRELTAKFRNEDNYSFNGMRPAPDLPTDDRYLAMQELRARAVRTLRIGNSRTAVPDSSPKDPGRWSEDGKEYIIDDPLGTKAPWSMVASNGTIGFVATAAGWAYSFYGNKGKNGNNSQQGRITPYSPDMVAEAPLRGVMLKNKITGREWSLTPRHDPEAQYQVRVSPGYIKYILTGSGELEGLTATMTMFVDKEDPVEFWKIDVEYKGSEALDLEISSFVKWALGDRYPQTAHLTRSRFDPGSGAVFARNKKSIFPGSVAFHALAAKGDVENGTSMHREDDPFDGLSTSLHFDGKGTESIAFMLGQAESEAGTKELIKKYKAGGAVRHSFEAGTEKMRDTLGANTIMTPDASLNNLMPFMLYQADFAHTRARSGLNQSGGAFGFRDQLQTFTNLLATGDAGYYALARAHIIESTKHQFERRRVGDRMVGGDVQHWWHPHNNLGQRSRISDNLLWLPYALSRYLEATGDHSILDEITPWLALDEKEWENGELRPGEIDRCFVPRSTEEDKILSSVFEHCKATIDRGLDRMGEHGLPLIGSGDWNDALNRVGPKGRGESVWLAFFLYYNLAEFSKIAGIQAERCGAKGGQKNSAKAEEYRAAAAEYTEKARLLKENIEKYGWNKDHFIRAYTDSGDKLDLIDAIVQSWAVMSGAVPEKRARKAFKTAVERLYRAKHKIIMLFDRPVDDLIDYPPGIRENLAQYTHGTTWMVIAAAMLGDGDLAYRLFQALLPTTHSLDPNYGGEPYAVAADIYGPAKKFGDDQEGKAGWTWYTGAAGWIYRILMEYILGIRFRAGYMQIEPCIPKEWKNFSVTHRHRARPGNPGSTYSITFENPSGVCTGVKSIVETVFDKSGKQVGESVIVDITKGVKLADDGLEHRIQVVMGPADPVKKGVIAGMYAQIFDRFLIKPGPEPVMIRSIVPAIRPQETLQMLSAS